MERPRGRSLHIGLNGVDPSHYQGWPGTLAGCEYDAKDMQAVADSRGFKSTIVLTADAQSERVIQEIESAAAELRPGDIFFLTYSGHGGQVPDLNGEEGDERDETWVLYDRQLVDDELFALWGRFAAGVRIFLLSDSCHSGSVARDAFYAASPATVETSDRYKMMPRDTQDQVYEANRGLYDDIQHSNPQGDNVGIGASVLLISGCQDSQYSRDGDRNGLFTENLRDVWADGKFRGTYRSFHRAIVEQMPPDQSPNYFPVGAINPSFERQYPFTV